MPEQKMGQRGPQPRKKAIGYARSLYMPNREKPKSETANSHWCAQDVVICLLIGWETGFNYQLDTDNN